MDPSEFVDGPALYAFARNNPINLRDVSGRETEGTLVEYKLGGLGQGSKIHQLHFFPATQQQRLNPKWTRPLSASLKELTLIGSAKLNATDKKIAKYLSGIDRIRDQKHLLEVIHDVKDIWKEAGVSGDIVDRWAKSSFATARKIGITGKLPPVGPSVLRRQKGGALSDASGFMGKAGKVFKVLAVGSALLAGGEALAYAAKGDFGGAARVIGEYAYDQTVGVAVDIGRGVKSVVDFVRDPLAGIRATIDEIRRSQEEQFSIFSNVDDAEAPKMPAPATPATPAPASPKPNRGNAAQGLLLLYSAIVLAAQAPNEPPPEPQTPDSEKIDLGEILCDEVEDFDELNDYLYTCAD